MAAAILFSLVVSAQSLADDQILTLADMSLEELYDLEVVDVSIATKTPVPLKRAPAMVTVITYDEMVRMGAITLGDALKHVPGLSILKTSHFGKKSISVRGAQNTEGDLILFNVDNHNVAQYIAGSASWMFLTMQVENIKRVEIIRGPGSALYGANAAAGVINVITKSYEDIPESTFTVRAGTRDERNISGLGTVQWGDWHISTLLNYHDMANSGTHVTRDSIGVSGELQDRQEKSELHIKAENGPWTASAYYTRQIDGDQVGPLVMLNDESNLDIYQYYFTLTYDEGVTEEIHLNVNAYYDSMTQDMFYEAVPENVWVGFDDGLFANTYATDVSQGIDIQLDTTIWDRHTLTLGLSLYKQETDPGANGNYDPITFDPLPGGYGPIASMIPKRSRTINAIYLQDIIRVTDDLEATLGIRRDDYSNTSGSTNPRAALVWSISPDTHLKLMHGRAYKTPLVSELYQTNNPAYTGNPDLKPSIINTNEISLNHQYDQTLSVQATLFHTRLKDAILLTGGTWENAGNQNIQGSEFEVSFGNPKESYGYANITFIDATDADTREKLPDIANRIANLGYNTKITPQLNWNVNMHYNGEVKRAAADPREDLGGYTITDTTFILSDKKGDKSLRLAIRNLFDKAYVNSDPTGASGGLYDDYPHLGRQFYLEGRWNF